MKTTTYAALLLLSARAVEACPTCVNGAVASTRGGTQVATDLAQGLNYSILLMMSMPFLLAGILAGTLGYLVWKNGRDGEGAA